MSVKVIPEKIHLQAFRIVDAQMQSPFEFESDKIERFETTSDFDLTFNWEDSMIKADFKVDVKSFSLANTNKDEASALFHFVYIYYVENFKDLAQILDNETLDLKGGLANAIAAITYSTSRGILMTRFQGTALSDFILPVIDPNKLIRAKK